MEIDPNPPIDDEAKDAELPEPDLPQEEEDVQNDDTEEKP